MMRSHFDEQLALLNKELIEMGALCEEVIELASRALAEGNKSLAVQIAPIDAQIDQKERTIESMCLRLLLQQQPVAKDLRQISAALKMITDMERIGDQAEDIAEIICFLKEEDRKEDILLPEMAKASIGMVTESVDAFVKRDIMLAEKVIKDDDIVDRYFDRVKEDLIRKIADDPKDGEYAIDLLIIAKYYERIADHAVNIAKWVIFSVTGVHKEDDRCTVNGLLIPHLFHVLLLSGNKVNPEIVRFLLLHRGIFSPSIRQHLTKTLPKRHLPDFACLRNTREQSA